MKSESTLLRHPGHLVPVCRLAALCALSALVACATPPQPGAAEPAMTAPAPKPASVRPVPPPPQNPVPVPPPPVILTPQETQKAISTSIELLEAGQDDLANAELQKVVQGDPSNRLAQSLLKQIHDDPVAMLGATSFAYRVPAGETLSRIAQRYLNDPLLFYILARYNNIKVPRNLAEGQTLRIPGRASAATLAPVPKETAPSAQREATPAPAPAPTREPTPAPAPAPPPPAPAPTPAPAPEPPPETPAAKNARLEKQKADAVARHTRSARSAFAKQDLQGALLGWDAVLAIEPDNATARLERQRVLALMAKLVNVK